MGQVQSFDPYMLALSFLIDEGLDHCDRDIQDEKGAAFPMLCNECEYSGKEICQKIKSSSERTTTAIQALTYGLNYVANLKEGKEVQLDPWQAGLQAFRFTTYHGNLNELLSEEYAERKQLLMDHTVEKLEESVVRLRRIIPYMIKGDLPVLLKYQNKGEEVVTPKSDSMTKALSDKNISFSEVDIREELKKDGIGTEWIDDYVRMMKDA